MILSYRWEPALQQWVVVDTRTNQKLSSHFDEDEAKELISQLEVNQHKIALPPKRL